MAKGDKSGKGDKGEDGYAFEVPDFDEDAFIHKELVSFKTTSILVVWGILAALISWGLYSVLDGAKTAWYAGIVVVVIFGYALKFVYPRLNIDISHFGRREWLGTGFLLFFTWLAFSMLLLNPPISDHAEPNVNIFASPPLQMAGGDITFDIFFDDNHRIAESAIRLTHGGGSIVATQADFAKISSDHYQYVLQGAAATTYTINATATDAAGHTSSVEEKVVASSRAIRFEDDGTLDNHELASRTEVLLVTLAADVAVRAVYLDLDGDGALTIGADVVMEYTESLGGWQATANSAGWKEGNNTFQVVVETMNRFQGLTLIEGETIKLSSPNYWLDVTAAIGDYQAAVMPQLTISPNEQRTPGVGLVAIIGILGAAAISRRR